MAEPPPLYRRSPDGWELVECENCHLLTAEFVRLTRELAEARQQIERVEGFRNQLREDDEGWIADILTDALAGAARDDQDDALGVSQ